MNKFILFVILLFSVLAGVAQNNVVNWTFESKKLADNNYEVKLIATVQQPWHIYSTTQAEGGPLPTAIAFTKNPLAVPQGKIKEVGKLETHYEKVFELDTKFFSNKVEFVQIFKVKGKAKTNVKGTVEFMTCNDRECLPPQEIPFTIALK